MAWMDFQLPVGDEVYIYYGGYARGHKVERFTERQIGLVRIKRDRYVAREAAGEGLLRTRLMKFQGARVTLNVQASEGEARAQLLDEKEEPVPGFTFSDCAPVKSDSVNAPLRWRGEWSQIKSRPVHLEISLRNAKVFAFNVEEEVK
jgi:hypothetical protein